MVDIFLRLLNVGFTAGYLVLAVFLLRFLLKKAPKWIRGILWGLVAVRLILPFPVESAFSLIPSAEVLSASAVEYGTTLTVNSGIPAVDRVLNPVLGSAAAPDPARSVDPWQVAAELAGVVWLVGCLAMLTYAAISTVKLRRRVREAVPVRERVFACDAVGSPFILGIFRPRIYVPSGLDDRAEALILLHEEAHIRRGDHFWKPFGFLLLSVYWFHPLLWVSYVLLCRDIELACDEKVIGGLEKEGVADYSETLLRFSVPGRLITACPVAFGEVSVKERVKSVLNYKKPAFWLLLLALVLCAVTAVCLLTDPVKEYKIPWDQFCVTDAGQEIVLPWADKEYIADLLNRGSWESDSRAAEAATVGFYFQRQIVRYQGGTGTFYDETGKKNLTVTESERLRINAMLTGNGGAGGAHVPDPSTLFLTVSAQRLSTLEPVIVVVWQNIGEADFSFGKGYCVYHMTGGRAEKMTGDHAVTLELILLPAGGEYKRTYDLSSFTFAEGESYRLYLNGFEESDYWVDFLYKGGQILLTTIPDGAQPARGTDSDVFTTITGAEQPVQSTEPDVFSPEGVLKLPALASARLDIDGDGVREDCSIVGGPTSGLFTVVISARAGGEVKYRNTFVLSPAEMRFDDSDGVPVLWMNDEKHRLSVTDRRIVIEDLDPEYEGYYGGADWNRDLK